MGVGIVDPLAVEPLAEAVPPQEIVGIVDLMAALTQHGAAVFLADVLGGGLHAGGIGDGHAGEDLRLGDVGSQDCRQRQQLPAQGLHRVIPQQLCPGGGHHHGVHHDVLRLVLLQFFRDDHDEVGGGNHADLHRVGENIGKNSVQLLTQEMRSGLQNICDAGGVLGGQGRDGAHGVNAVGRHGLHIRLDTGASAGIASSNGQCCFHVNTSFLFYSTFYKAIQGGAPNVPPEHRARP